MAVVYISEYSNLAKDLKIGKVNAGVEPALATQTVAIGGASVQSAALNAKTRFVRLHTDAICSFKFGVNPTATATDARLAANTTEFFGVDQLAAEAGTLEIAIITNT